MGRAGNRGNLRFEILSAIADQPRHGYDIMLELESRRGGFRPSPGSIYPALQMLEDAGFIRGREEDGKRIFEITDTGRATLAEYTEKGGFERDADEDATRELFGKGAIALRGLVDAAKQVARLGNPRALERAAEVIDRARREIYTILAEET
jgi:DNA-binding PadR family transcriptional regulator